jgi:hypothetical protein
MINVPGKQAIKKTACKVTILCGDGRLVPGPVPSLVPNGGAASGHEGTG